MSLFRKVKNSVKKVKSTAKNAVRKTTKVVPRKPLTLATRTVPKRVIGGIQKALPKKISNSTSRIQKAASDKAKSTIKRKKKTTNDTSKAASTQQKKAKTHVNSVKKKASASATKNMSVAKKTNQKRNPPALGLEAFTSNIVEDQYTDLEVPALGLDTFEETSVEDSNDAFDTLGGGSNDSGYIQSSTEGELEESDNEMQKWGLIGLFTVLVMSFFLLKK